MQYVANIQRILLTPASSRTDTNIHYSSSPRHNQTLGWDFPVMVTKWSNIIFALEWRISPSPPKIGHFSHHKFGFFRNYLNIWLWRGWKDKSLRLFWWVKREHLKYYFFLTTVHYLGNFYSKLKEICKYDFQIFYICMANIAYSWSQCPGPSCLRFESQTSPTFSFKWIKSFVFDAFWPERQYITISGGADTDWSWTELIPSY